MSISRCVDSRVDARRRSAMQTGKENIPVHYDLSISSEDQDGHALTSRGIASVEWNDDAVMIANNRVDNRDAHSRFLPFVPSTSDRHPCEVVVYTPDDWLHDLEDLIVDPSDHNQITSTPKVTNSNTSTSSPLSTIQDDLVEGHCTKTGDSFYYDWNSTDQSITPMYRYDIDGYLVVSMGLSILNIQGITVYHLPLRTLLFTICGFLTTRSLVITPSNSWMEYIMGYASRRLRRLGPALCFVVAMSSIIASGLCLGLLVENSKYQAIAGLSFLANFLDWSGDYSTSIIPDNMFSHLWVLSLQVQFMIYQCGYLGLTRAAGPHSSPEGHRKALWGLLLTGAFSLMFVLAGTLGLPQSLRRSLAEMTLLGRLWEFNCGAITFFYSHHLGLIDHRRVSNDEEIPPNGRIKSVISVILCALIVFSMVLVPHRYSVPALLCSVVISLCTAALIVVNRSQDSYFAFVMRLMSPLVRFSYALYLWQMPLQQFIGPVISYRPSISQFLSTTLYLGLLTAFSIVTYLFVQWPLMQIRTNNWCRSLVLDNFMFSIAAAAVIIFPRLPAPLCWFKTDLIGISWPELGPGSAFQVDGSSLSGFCSRTDLLRAQSFDRHRDLYCCMNVSHPTYLEHANNVLTVPIASNSSALFPSTDTCRQEANGIPLGHCLPSIRITADPFAAIDTVPTGEVLLLGDTAARDLDYTTFLIAQDLGFDFYPVHHPSASLFGDVLHNDCFALDPETEDLGWLQRRVGTYFASNHEADKNQTPKVIVIALSEASVPRFHEDKCSKMLASAVNELVASWGLPTVFLVFDESTTLTPSTENGEAVPTSNPIFYQLETSEKENNHLIYKDMRSMVFEEFSDPSKAEGLFTTSGVGFSCLGKLAMRNPIRKLIQDILDSSSGEGIG